MATCVRRSDFQRFPIEKKVFSTSPEELGIYGISIDRSLVVPGQKVDVIVSYFNSRLLPNADFRLTGNFCIPRMMITAPEDKLAALFASHIVELISVSHLPIKPVVATHNQVDQLKLFDIFFPNNDQTQEFIQLGFYREADPEDPFTTRTFALINRQAGQTRVDATKIIVQNPDLTFNLLSHFTPKAQEQVLSTLDAPHGVSFPETRKITRLCQLSEEDPSSLILRTFMLDEIKGH